ncbi:MAG: hypothetical protein ACRCX2_03830 [Paraclostridium sp.]
MKNIVLIILISVIVMGLTQIMSSAFEKELSNKDIEVNKHLEYVKTLN